MSPSEPQERLTEVVEGFLAGDGSYYEAIRTQIRKFVAVQALDAGTDREEVVSEIIAALYRNLQGNKFNGDSLKALEVYIFSMVKNTVCNFQRKQRRVQYWGELPAAYEVPSSPYDSGVTKRDLSEKILAGLDTSCRELLEKKFRNFWSDKELAEHYGKTKNAISTAISRCVKKAQNLEIVKKEL